MTPKFLFWFWKNEAINRDEEDYWGCHFCHKNQNSFVSYATIEMAIRKLSSCQVLRYMSLDLMGNVSEKCKFGNHQCIDNI